MEGCSKNSNNETCPKLLDLIPRETEWLNRNSHENSCKEEIRKLELRLAPPGQEENNNNHSHNLLCLSTSSSSAGWYNQEQGRNLFDVQKNLSKESSQSQHCCIKAADLQQQKQDISTEKKVFSPPSAAITAVPNSTTISQKRTAPGPVVGWPPIRSFRKNLATSSSSKQSIDHTQNEINPNKKVASEKPPATPVVEPCKKGMFVKINMDGVPIGRKVDLKAYDSYEKLSTAVDQLFRGLLAAQRNSSEGNEQGEEKAITGVLGGSGEYTLVYEDNEGDRMLVGDVPWHMFVSAVKRLRVLKSSDVSSLSLGSGKQDKVAMK